ncbi:MAG: PTS IIA-like nitrogen regulatory protein PtsN [Thiohalomonadaceae bacterium]
MRVPDLITVDRIACDSEAGSKKRALELVSALIARGESGLGDAEVFDSLLARERLGSTGLGHGVALPHGRVKTSEQTVGAFLRLKKGVDFDAVDREPVDLLFAMLVPEHSTDEHLQLLAQLAEMFSDTDMRRRLREAADAEAVKRLIDSWRPGTA